ncbi:MAG: hypothetical protein PVI91_13390 [Gammaproteobacteria bacterium]|jgi:hypothetical protein
MKAHDILQVLLDGGAVPLGAWMAQPLLPADANVWLSRIQQRLRADYGRGEAGFSIRLAEIIARYWCDAEPRMHYQNLLAVLEADHPRAQLELCYGQLLIARKRRRAWPHLERGFALAANLFEPEEYFRVLRRHACLRYLPLSEPGTEPVALESLMQEAGVIRRLRGADRGYDLTAGRHRDTVD